MAKWNEKANVQFANLQNWSGLNNSELDALRLSISAWADGSPDEETQFFKFGRFKQGGLRVSLDQGWIADIVFME